MNYSLKDEELIKRLPHFGRMLDEYFELNQKLEKLVVFKETPTFNLLSDIEKNLLLEQEEIEIKLLEVLNKRINYIRDNK